MKKIIYILTLFVLVFALVGCGIYTPPTSTTTEEQQITETNQERLIKNQPVPQIDVSLERQNLIKRIQLLNDENKVFYVYLISYGKVMAFYTAQNKVTSLNTYLTGKEKLSYMRARYGDYSSSSYSGFYLVESPDLDGTYGDNTDGIFFFTTEGAYVEWKGEYMVSDYPLKLSTPPELVRTIE